MKKYLLILLSVMFAGACFGQMTFNASYSIAMPMGDLGDYIGKTSFRGASIELSKEIKSNLEIGLETGWNVFYEKFDKQVYTEGTTSLHGKQYRYANVVPIILGGRYFFNTSSSRITPFGALGIGTLYVNRSIDFGMYRLTSDTWQFAVRPEVGIRIATRGDAAAVIAVKYYSGFETDEMPGNSYLAANIGVVFNP